MSKFRKCEFSAWGHLSLVAAFGSRCRPGGGCGLRWRRAAAAGGGPEAAPPTPPPGDRGLNGRQTHIACLERLLGIP